MMTFFLGSVEKLMKLEPAPTTSKRILKSVWVVAVQSGFAMVSQVPRGPTVIPRRA
jgi:hypothetical protein